MDTTKSRKEIDKVIAKYPQHHKKMNNDKSTKLCRTLKTRLRNITPLKKQGIITDANTKVSKDNT